MLLGSAPVRFVQGEAYKYEIQFDEQNYQNITSVHISCNALNFCHKLQQDAQNKRKWFYLFTSNETKSLKVVKTTYSITVGNKIPELDPQILAEQPFEVKNNSNPRCIGD